MTETSGYGTSMHFPYCKDGRCTGCLPPLERSEYEGNWTDAPRAPWYAPFCRTSKPHATLPHDPKVHKECGCPCHGGDHAWSCTQH